MAPPSTARYDAELALLASKGVPFVAESSAIEPLRCSAVLTHHWLVRRRGGEKVLEAIGELLPEAPIYTFVHDRAGMADSPLAARAVHPSLLQWLPGSRRYYPKLLPLLPLAARAVRLPPADLVVCSDAAIAKAMRVHARSKLVCYCYTPMRYVYEEEIGRQYRQALSPGLRPLWGMTAAYVRGADRRAARRVDLFVADSRHVAQRIANAYGAQAVVVYPPVELPAEPPAREREDFYLCVGYHVPYKRLDVAVAACRLMKRRLVVIGEGPEVQRIDRRRDPHVEVLGWQTTETIWDYLSRAAGLLFPGEEDFGIVPVEAIAHGCPVIAYGVGGATETVIHNESGVLFGTQTPEALAEAIRYCEMLSFDAPAMHAYAQRFSKSRFLSEMRAILGSVLAGEEVKGQAPPVNP